MLNYQGYQRELHPPPLSYAPDRTPVRAPCAAQLFTSRDPCPRKAWSPSIQYGGWVKSFRDIIFSDFLHIYLIFKPSKSQVIKGTIPFFQSFQNRLFNVRFKRSFVEVVILIFEDPSSDMDVDQFLSTVFPSKRDENIATPR